MCTILDANVKHEVFGQCERPSAGKEYFEWINGKKGNKSLKLVIGGKLTHELLRDKRVSDWLTEGYRRGRVVQISDEHLDKVKSEIKHVRVKSNDRHVIELAISSGARLLYSNDKNLQDDFTSGKVIKEPRGKVYSTMISRDVDNRKRKLLRSAQCKRCLEGVSG